MAEVVAKYKLDVNDAVKNLDKLQKETKSLDNDLDKAGKDGTKSLDNVGKKASGLSSTFKKLGGVIAAAFAVDRVISIGKEMVNVAAKAEGVERAFKRIGSASLLKDFRAATRGTVSDLLLMQRAVQASNFKIPLDQLAGLLRFAQARARETGESVDYLVDSIVLGIGRKSPLILDNLGISAVELRERLKGVGVEATSVADIARIVGDIASEELGKMGEQADTTADKLAQLTTIWDNFLVVGGNALINLGTGFAFILGQLDMLDVALTANEKAAKNLAASFGDDLVGVVDEMVKKNQELLDSQLKVAELEETRGYQNSREAINNINEQIKAEEERQSFLRKYVEELKKIYDASKPVNEVQKEEIRNIFFLKSAIEELVKERGSQSTSLERIAEINKELIPLQEELDRLLGKQAKALKESYAEMELTRVSMSETVPIVNSMISTLQGLNKELQRQSQILNTSPEFSKQYNDASDAIDKLEKKIKEFNDDYIDPSQGNPDYAAGGSMSATGQGLLNIGGGESGGVSSPFDIEGWTEDQEEAVALFQEYADAVLDISNSITNAIIAGHNAEINSLDYQLKTGQITRETYDKKRRELEKKKAVSEKNAAIFNAIISTASAVAEALPNVVLAGIAGALGLIQIGIIAGTPLPAFKDGVIGLQGAGTETSDSIPAMLSKNESVMTAKETKAYREELLAMRNGGFEQLILTKYVKPMIDESLFNGFGDIGKSARLNGITANLKDHNILHGLDRLRQSQTQGFQFLAKELKQSQPKRGGYRA